MIGRRHGQLAVGLALVFDQRLVVTLRHKREIPPALRRNPHLDVVHLRSARAAAEFLADVS